MKSVDKLRASVPLDFIKDEDWHRALPELTLAARYSALSRALKSQELIRIRRGLYVFGTR